MTDSKKVKQNLNEKKKDKIVVEQSDKAIELIMYNKINTKNAFDVNVEFLESISNLLNKKEDNSWQKASASLDATAKIYGYRVDSVHTETYKFLGGLSRNEKQNEDDDDVRGGGENEEKKEKDKRGHGKHEGYSTLEKDVKKLNLNKYDLEFEVDPLFRSMTAKFNETGARGLLLNNLPLDNNLDLLLESKEEELKEDKLAKCSLNANDFSIESKRIIEGFVSNLTVNELTSMQIAPDLGYFKRTRELETSLEKTFYNNFMSELENNDADLDNLHDSVIMPMDDNNIPDNISIMSQNKSEIDSVMSQQLDEGGLNTGDNDINIAGNLQNLNNTTGFIGEGFSLFKHDDILNHEGQFGDGSRDILKNLPQFQNFVKAFNQLDKNTFLKKGGQKEGKRVKKEEKLFDFCDDNEVNKNDIFGKESKKAMPNAIVTKKEKKKKVKLFYNYDKYSVFKLFTIPNKQIIHYNMNKRGEGEEGVNNEDGDNDNNNNNMPFGNDDNNNIGGGGDDGMGMSFNNDESIANVNNTNLPNATFLKFDQEYEKKFGNLYKKFDVRFLKTKLWDSYEKMEVNPNKKEEVEFKSVIGKMTNTLSKNVIDNISTATCFVCFLHLCNEKNLELRQSSDNNFFIGQNLV